MATTWLRVFAPAGTSRDLDADVVTSDGGVVSFAWVAQRDARSAIAARGGAIFSEVHVEDRWIVAIRPRPALRE